MPFLSSSSPSSSSSLDPANMDITQVKCNKKGCGLIFNTDAEMKSHKYHSPDHFYCRKCDYDAGDWEGMLQHKVESMAPFLIGERQHDKHKKMMHLCCEFCSMNSKSLEGRLNHRRQEHQAPQNVVCAGHGPVYDEATREVIDEPCGQIFLRASDLVEHLEKGCCPYIKSSDFHAERQHKHIIKQILADPDFFTGNMCASRAMAEIDFFPELPSSKTTTVSSSQNGGIALLDDDTASQCTFSSLKPSRHQQNFLDQDVDNISGPLARATLETWPRRPTGKAYQDIMSGKSSTIFRPKVRDSVNGGAHEAWETGSETSQSTVRADSVSSGTTSSILYKNTASVQEFVTSLQGPGARSVSPTSTHPEGRVDWQAITRTQQHDVLHPTLESSASPTAHQRVNLFNSRWYDPHSPTYNPDLFWHSLLQRYKCPFAGCDVDFAASDQMDMEMHLRYTHVITEPACPMCFKKFRTVTSLVRHFETSLQGSKCRIATTSDFERIVDEVTGGFLALSRGRSKKENVLSGWTQDKSGKAVRRPGRGEGGVKELQFRGEVPPEWEGNAIAAEALEAGNGWQTIEPKKKGKKTKEIEW